MKDLIPMWIAVWLVLSLSGSFFKVLPSSKGSNCGKTYPIDYILYNELFCEIKEEE